MFHPGTRDLTTVKTAIQTAGRPLQPMRTTRTPQTVTEQTAAEQMITPELAVVPAMGRKTVLRPVQERPPVLTAVPGPVQKPTTVLTADQGPAQEPAPALKTVQELMKQRPETDQIKVPAKTQRAERPAQDRIPVTAQAAETAVPDRIPERRGPAIAAQGKVQGKAQGRAAQTLSPISNLVLLRIRRARNRSVIRTSLRFMISGIPRSSRSKTRSPSFGTKRRRYCGS